MRKASVDYTVDLSLPWLASVMLLFSSSYEKIKAYLTITVEALSFGDVGCFVSGKSVRSRYKSKEHTQSKIYRCNRLHKKGYHSEGVTGFYRGCATNLIRTTPAAVITFTSFEMIHRFLLDVFLCLNSNPNR
ncbi:hypothetical protein GUJ93_ZPchr0010g9898 [Zizania palustris]|uniref:Uncharacterized protein n=1 Tax=Zizania palustris TaxID=103762 RepID=A0A8J5W9D8_ZIZPA|nr:hypothetical protein GUJ93_ZPchr0010g9898 [Zizania palustris]